MQPSNASTKTKPLVPSSKPLRRPFGPALAVALVLALPTGLWLARDFEGRTFLFLLTAWAVAWVVSFGLHWTDKRRAEAGTRRISEKILHLWELLGGWPGAFVAQRVLRHKTAKVSYQIVFWLIVGLHVALALDFLFGGWIAQRILAQ